MTDDAATILVVEDERAIRRALELNLRAAGYRVVTAEDGVSALRVASRTHPDLVVLDLDLPAMDGAEVIEGLRGWTSVPILVLSARDAEAEKVRALDLGADDYVTKPFGVEEVLARVRAALRRSAPPPEEQATVAAGDVVVDLAARRVTRAGERRHHPPWAMMAR